MWVAVLVLGAIAIALGIVLVLYAERISLWRKRRYGESVPRADLLRLRGTIAVAVGIGAVVLGLARI
jgi:hypothetical protein